MPRPSQEEKILDAALHVFVRYSYEGTRIRHIAEAAAVSEGALYKHYPSKEAVAMALFTRYMGEYVQRLHTVAARSIAVKERLHAVIATSFAAYRANPDAIAYILIERPRLIEQMPEGFVYPLEIVGQILTEGQATQVIRSGDRRLLAAIFFGCFLRPIIVSRSSEAHPLDLINDLSHEQIITDAAWAAVARGG